MIHDRYHALAPHQLLARILAGDEVALGPLLEDYRNYLKIIARLQIDQRLQGKLDSSDIVQETFLKAQEDFNQFRGQTEVEFLAWLRKILARTLASQVRHYLGRQCRDVRLECRLADELDQSSQALGQVLRSPAASPSRMAANREQAVLLADALEKLPEHYRDVLFLRHLEGKTFTEIAEQMNRSVGSVEKIWVRALARIRTIVREELCTDPTGTMVV